MQKTTGRKPNWDRKVVAMPALKITRNAQSSAIQNVSSRGGGGLWGGERGVCLTRCGFPVGCMSSCFSRVTYVQLLDRGNRDILVVRLFAYKNHFVILPIALSAVHPLTNGLHCLLCAALMDSCIAGLPLAKAKQFFFFLIKRM